MKLASALTIALLTLAACGTAFDPFTPNDSTGADAAGSDGSGNDGNANDGGPRAPAIVVNCADPRIACE